MLALTHERVEDALMLPVKLTATGGRMQEQLKRTLVEMRREITINRDNGLTARADKAVN